MLKLGWSRFIVLFLACFKSIEIGRFPHEANQPSLHQASQKTGSLLIHPAFLLVPASERPFEPFKGPFCARPDLCVIRTCTGAELECFVASLLRGSNTFPG